MKQLTKDEAIDFAARESWRTLTDEQIVHFQMEQDKLCIPFSRFHEAMEKCLGRPVWTHEFADRKALHDELKGKVKKPSIIENLHKAITVALDDGELT